MTAREPNHHAGERARSVMSTRRYWRRRNSTVGTPQAWDPVAARRFVDLVIAAFPGTVELRRTTTRNGAR